jgi:hypothetical protein
MSVSILWFVERWLCALISVRYNFLKNSGKATPDAPERRSGKKNLAGQARRLLAALVRNQPGGKYRCEVVLSMTLSPTFLFSS